MKNQFSALFPEAFRIIALGVLTAAILTGITYALIKTETPLTPNCEKIIPGE